MNDVTPQTGVGSSADAVKHVVAVLLVIAGIVAFYVLQTQSDWVRWGAVAAGIVLAVAVFASSARGRQVWQFVLDSRLELRKVSWPNRQETTQTTIAVFVFAVAMGLFFYGLDFVLSLAMRFFTGPGG